MGAAHSYTQLELPSQIHGSKGEIKLKRQHKCQRCWNYLSHLAILPKYIKYINIATVNAAVATNSEWLAMYAVHSLNSCLKRMGFFIN